jgi:hypothetical protein
MEVERQSDFRHLSQRIRFFLVNNRVPRTDERCALCGSILEQGYVRALRHG